MEVRHECRIENHERCTKQSAPIAVKNVKSRSNLTLAGLFTVATVGRREGNQEEGPDTRFHRLNHLITKLSVRALCAHVCLVFCNTLKAKFAFKELGTWLPSVL